MSSRGEYSVANARRFDWSSVTGTLHPERIAHLQQHLRGKTVLDAGCGGGAYVNYLAENGWQATGLERSEDFLRLARGNGATGQFVLGDVVALPFADRQFDSVYCYDVIEHVEDDQRAINELCRVAGQRLILAVPAHDDNVLGHGVTFSHYQDLTHLRTYTRRSLTDLLHAAGQTRIVIEPELAVDLRGLARQHLAVPSRQEMKSSGSSTWTFLKRKGLSAMLERLLPKARYDTIYTGWMVVVEVSA